MSLKSYNTAFYLLCIISLLAMFSTSIVMPLLAIYAKDIGAAGVWIGLSVAAYWIARVILEIPSGFISTKYGYYLPMAAGLILTAAGNLLCAFVSDPIQLFLARALMGLGAPLFFAVSMTLIINIFSAERRGSAMGLFQGVEMLGSILGSAASGYIVTGIGFVGSFYFSTVLVVVAMALIVLPSIRKECNIQPQQANLSLRQIPKVLTNKGLLIICGITIASYILSNGILYTTYPLYLSDQLKMSLTDIGLVQGARSIGYVLSMLVMGFVADRIGRKYVLIFGALGTAIITVLLNFATGFWVINGVLFLMGVTTGALWIICPVIAAEAVDPSYRGAAVGTYRTFFDLGSILGPILMIAVVDIYGNGVSLYLSALLLFLTFLPSLALREAWTTTSTEKVNKLR